MPDVFMPRLSDTMAEGVISQWLKHAGDDVHKGDVLAEIETDKAVMELEAYDDGVLERIVVDQGTTVPIGTTIAVIGDGSGTSQSPPPPPAAAPDGGSASPAPDATTAQPAGGQPPAAASPDAGARPAPSPAANGAPRTSPLARAIARDHGIDLASVTGSGPGGRIVRADVEAAVAAAESATAAQLPAAPVAAEDEEIPLSAVRRVTARRLTESAAAPHFYLTSVVDVGPLLAFRRDINEQLSSTGVKVSVTDLLIRACAATLREHPQVNSSWAGDKLLRHRRIHVGVAVALDDGLIVPVVRDADRKSLGEVSQEARALAERARAGKLAPDEFTGGTFTISNLGMFGVDHFTAIINPPEAAILAVGAASEEPVVRDGELATRSILKLTLSIDHRVLDGATAARFLRDLKAILEEPLRIVV